MNTNTPTLPLEGLAEWLRKHIERFDIARHDPVVKEHIEKLSTWADEVEAAQRAPSLPLGDVATGFDGSSVRAGSNHSTIEIWYDTHEQAIAARDAFLAMMDASRLAAPPAQPPGLVQQAQAGARVKHLLENPGELAKFVKAAEDNAADYRNLCSECAALREQLASAPAAAEPRIDPMQDPMRPTYAKLGPGDEHPAEEVLRKLACWLGVGGYNAPAVDAEVFHEKIVWGVNHLLKCASAAAPAGAASLAPSEPDGWLLLNKDGGWLATYSLEENAKFRAHKLGGTVKPFYLAALASTPPQAGKAPRVTKGMVSAMAASLDDLEGVSKRIVEIKEKYGAGEAPRMLTPMEVQSAYLVAFGYSASSSAYQFAYNLIELYKRANQGRTIPAAEGEKS